MGKPAQNRLIILTALLVCLAGCAPQPGLPTPPAPNRATLTPWIFQTATPQVEPTAQQVSLSVTRTPEPAPLTSLTPVAQRPALPTLPAIKVSALAALGGQANLSHLAELERWGKGSILYLDYTPDGKRLVLATRRGISICDALSLREERFIEVAGGVPMLAVSPDGRTLAAATWSSRLTLYDIEKGSTLRTLDNGDHGAPLALRFLTDGRTISLGTTGEINLMWDAETGKLVHRWYTTGNSAMGASPSGDVLATADWNGSIFLWSGLDGRSPGRFWRDSEVQVVRFSPDGGLLAGGYGDGKAGVWDVLDAKMRYSLPHAGRVSALAFSPDGTILATGSWDNQVVLWRASDGKALRTLSGFQGRVNQVSFSPDGNNLATLAGDGLLRVWRIYDGGLAAQTLDYVGLRQAVFTGGSQLVAAGDDGSLQVWDALSGERRELPEAQPGGIGSLDASADGRWLATSGLDGNLRAWALPEMDLALELWMDEGWVNGVALSTDGAWLAAAGPGMLRVWSLPEGELAAEIDTGADTALGMGFTPDGRLLAAGSMDGSLRVWRVDDGSPQQTLREEGKFIGALAFGVGGQTLASGGDESALSIWRLYNATLAHTISGKKDDRLAALAFSPDGQVLAAAWWDYSLRFYNPANGALLHSLQFTAAVRKVVFSADGRLLALSLEDGTVRVWGVK